MGAVARRTFAVFLMATGVASALALTAPSAHASSRYCGKITFEASNLRVKVYAHNVRCHEARHVGHIWGRGGRPKHWICSAADRTCYRHSVTSSHYVHFNRVRHHGTRPGPPIAPGSRR